MNVRNCVALFSLSFVLATAIVGCTGSQSTQATKGDEHGHNEGGHKEQSLSDAEVKTPESFAAGVARLSELEKQIAQLIERNELDDVHHAAEEMAIVARKMKPLAMRDLTEDKRVEAGRLCNDIANFFDPIDSAADNGKKDETMLIHHQMVGTISKLNALSGK